MFYTYLWNRADATPYYVGKGSGDRAWSHSADECLRRPKEDARIFVQHWPSEAEAFEMEKFYIRLFGRKDLGTGILRNRTDGGEGASGQIYSPVSRQQMSASAKARGYKPHVIALLAQVNKGRTPHNKGKKHSDETRRKMRESSKHTAWNKGKAMPEGFSDKISEVLKGNQYALGNAGFKGRTHSKEATLKMSKSHRGTKLSEETRRKMSEAHLRRNALLKTHLP